MQAVQAAQRENGGTIQFDRAFAGQPDNGMPAVNGKFLLSIEKALEVINAHPVFESVANAEPLPIVGNPDSEADQGVQSPFEPDDYENAMRSAG